LGAAIVFHNCCKDCYSSQILAAYGIPSNAPEGTHQTVAIGDVTVRVAFGSGLAIPGYTLIFNLEDAAALWQILANAGAIPLG
jgi:hypothetical protein